MVSLQSALLPEASRRPPCLSFVDASVVASTATSKKRKWDGEEAEQEEDGIELNFDAAPLPLEWQRCLDIKSGQIHYYNTRTHKRTSKDPRRAAAATPVAVEEEDAGNCAPAGLDLDLNLAFEPRRRSPVRAEKKPRPAADHAKPTAAADREDAAPAVASSGGVEMVAAVCMRCHMLVMMCRACPSCPNCKFLHPTAGRASASPPARAPEPAPLKLGLQLLCCRD
ncbi:hypothetical protein ACQ4PT_014264 [Festuca glaucescens]